MQDQVMRLVKHEYTTRELADLQKEVTEALQRVYELEAQKAAATASLTGALKEAKATLSSLHSKARAGFEWIDTACVVVYHEPREGRKRFVRADDPAFVVGEEAMTPQEIAEQRQRNLEI